MAKAACEKCISLWSAPRAVAWCKKSRWPELKETTGAFAGRVDCDCANERAKG